MRVPNYPVFDDHGNLYVSDSGTWGARDGFIWKIAPGGTKAEIWDRQANGFTNGMCLSADGAALYVVESSPPLISRVAIKPTAAPVNAASSSSCRAGAGRRRLRRGRRSLHQPLQSQHRLSAAPPRGELITLYDDWEQLMLVAPTNIAFGGPDMET